MKQKCPSKLISVGTGKEINEFHQNLNRHVDHRHAYNFGDIFGIEMCLLLIEQHFIIPAHKSIYMIISQHIW